MTLAELLVSAAVTALAAGAALAAVMPLQQGFATQPEAAGLAQRARVVSDVLSADLRRASLVLPYRIGDVASDPQGGLFYRRDVVTIVTDPIDALTRGIVSPSESRTHYLKRDSDGTWQLMQYDGHESDLPAVEDVIDLRFEYTGEARPPVAAITESGTVRVSYGATPPSPGLDDPSDSWGPGENCIIAQADGTYVPRLASLGEAGLVLLGEHLLVDGPWCPDAAHTFRFDADLLRVRRVRVRVRLQAARPFRGVAGPWFRFAGSAPAARYVPDETLTLEIAPRNIDVAR